MLHFYTPENARKPYILHFKDCHGRDGERETNTPDSTGKTWEYPNLNAKLLRKKGVGAKCGWWGPSNHQCSNSTLYMIFLLIFFCFFKWNKKIVRKMNLEQMHILITLNNLYIIYVKSQEILWNLSAGLFLKLKVLIPSSYLFLLIKSSW